VEIVSLPRFARAFFACSLLATGLLIVGCDSGGSSSGDDGPSVSNTSSVMVEFESNSSSSSIEASSEKTAKASGDLTVTFVYQNNSESNCTLSETDSGINTSDYNKSFDPTTISGNCNDPANFDGVKSEFNPGSGSSVRELTLRILDGEGNELASDDGSDGGLSASATAPDDLNFPGDDSDGGDDDNSAGSQLPSVSLNLDGSPTVKTGTKVSLNGSFSDPDGDNLTFGWAFDKPDGSSSSLNGRESTDPTFTPDVTGSYSVSVSVLEESTGEPTAEIEVARAVTVAVTSSGEGGSVPSSLRGDWKIVEFYDASEDATETPDDEYFSFTEDRITSFDGKCFAAKLPITNVDGGKFTISTGSEAATNDFDVSGETLTLTTVSSSSTDGSAVGDVLTAERVSDFEFTGECSLDQ